MRIVKLKSAFGAFALWLLILAIPGNILGQRTNGTILGIVSDSTGARIPGAKVSVTNTGTGTAQSVTANGNGEYEVVGLPAGEYKLEAASNGFKAEIEKGVVLTVGATITVNMSLV